MDELRMERQVALTGKGRGAVWVYLNGGK
jgi:hypothetical protein